MLVILPHWLRRALPEGLADRLRRLVWKLPNLDKKLGSGVRVTVGSPSDWVLFNDIFVEGEYDEAIRLLADSAQDKEALEILDLGANVGYFTLRLLDQFRRLDVARRQLNVTMIEASPYLVRQLEKRVFEQASPSERLRIVQGLVGKRAGTGELIERGTHFTYSAVPTNGRRGRPVRYIDLDELFEKRAHIDLLKCDIEGSELSFLESYPDLLRRAAMAVVELHHDRCDTEQCLRLLYDQAFQHEKVLRSTDAISVHLFWR